MNKEKYKPQLEKINIHNNFGPADVAMIDYSGDGVKSHKKGIYDSEIYNSSSHLYGGT